MGALVRPKPVGRRRRQWASQHREISVSEFFTKNRHLLGFDNPAKALLTTVKEAVDNSLDACEEAGILPAIRVELHEVAEDRYRVIVQDNGPGIVRQQIPKVYGKLLYGSKFHRLKQGRGQQGIGISAAGMYGQLTTGKPVVITSRTGTRSPAHHFEIILDTRRNHPEIVKDETVEWHVDHGTRVEIELQGSYKGGKRSVDEYLEQTAIANPHAEFDYIPPKGRPPLHLPRVADELPPEPKEIQPHPYGVELGMLIKLLKEAKGKTVSGALQSEFSRVTARIADQIAQTAGVPVKTRATDLAPQQIERIFRAIPKVKIMAPPTDCVVPIGEELIRRGLERELIADFYVSTSRSPAVYRGNPFVIEVGLAYGGSLRNQEEDDGVLEVNRKAQDKAEGPITLVRFANRVPLQYQQSACAIFKAAVDVNWRQYGLAQPRGGLPLGPMVLLVHMASAWVPFTSESKEAIAHYPEILKEMQLALRDCSRKLASFLRSREKARMQARRNSIFRMYIGELAQSLGHLTGRNKAEIQKRLESMAAKFAPTEDDVTDVIDGAGEGEGPSTEEASETSAEVPKGTRAKKKKVAKKKTARRSKKT